MPLTPPITVVMPMFNAQLHVHEAIQSILTQTHDQFQLLVIDDGSTDGSVSLVDDLARRDSRVDLRRNPGSGQVDALNFGYQTSSSPYIAVMHADDVAMPTRLERQIAYLTDHPEVGAVGSEVDLLIEGKVVARPWSTRVATAPEQIDEVLSYESPIRHPTAMIGRDVLVRVGGYRRAFVAAEDYDLWLRIRDVAKLANVPEVLLRYRIHDGQVTVQQARQLVLSTLAAVKSRECRTAGKPDPFNDASLATQEMLEDMGMDSARIDAAVRWTQLTREVWLERCQRHWLRWGWRLARLGVARPGQVTRSLVRRVMQRRGTDA